jgi:hypothetical protein
VPGNLGGSRHYFFRISETDTIAFFEFKGTEELADNSLLGAGNHLAMTVPSEGELQNAKKTLELAGVKIKSELDHGFCHSICFEDPVNKIALEFATWTHPCDTAQPFLQDPDPVPAALSGAEMTSRYLVSTGTGVETGTSPRALAAAVVYDPDLLALRPCVAVTGAAAVAHCMEALSYPGVPESARDLAREGLLLLWDNLARVAAGTADLACRQDALAGASLAGRAHQAAGPGLLHLVCELAASRHVASYSVLSTLLLPEVLRAHGDEAGHARIALGDLRRGTPADTALKDFAVALGVTATLDELGIRASLTAITEQVGSLPAVQADRVASAARLRAALATGFTTEPQPVD